MPTLILLASIIGAALFFASGYFWASSSRNVEVEEESLDVASSSTPAAALARHERMPLQQALSRIAGHYGASNLGIYDQDGLLVQGAPGDPQLGLRVASLTHGLSFVPGHETGQKSVFCRVDGIWIQGLGCAAKPLWFVMHGASRELCEGDRSYLGQAVERELASAA